MQLNRLYILQLVGRAKALSKMPHYHDMTPLALSAMNPRDCDICQMIDGLFEELENQLGPKPDSAKTLKDFETLIMNDPLSNRLFQMGRQFERESLNKV